MIELLRSAFPPLRCEFNDKYAKHDISKLVDRSGNYERIIDVCDKVLDAFTFVDEWIRNHNMDKVPGDCWNISSICAHYQYFKHKPFILVSSRSPRVAHLECLTGNLDNFNCWRVDPYNHIPAIEDTWSFKCSKKISRAQYEYAMQLYTGGDVEFTYMTSARDGYDARKMIHDVFPQHPEVVELVNLEQVIDKLKTGKHAVNGW